MDSAGGTHIRVEREQSVGRVVLDRPAKLNTINRRLLEELQTAVETLAAEEAIRCLLLTGAGEKAFSAGADLGQLADGEVEPTDAVELARLGQRTFGSLERCDTPVVAAIDGYCLGGGMELAAAADLRLASSRATFGQPEHTLGLLPGWGGTQRLPRLLGESRAREIIFTAERYDAETMADYGFVTDVVDPEAFEDEALALAETLAAGPPIAQRYTKRAMLAGRGAFEAGLTAEAQAFGHLFGTDDFRAGLAAFEGEEEPEFTGQ